MGDGRLTGESAAARPVFPERGWFDALGETVAADTEMKAIGRWCTLNLALVIGEETVLLRLEGGGISKIIPGPDVGASWSVTLRGTLTDWLTFLQPVPPPFYTNLLAMNSRVPSFSIEGDRGTFVRHLRALTRIFGLAQRMGSGRA